MTYRSTAYEEYHKIILQMLVNFLSAYVQGFRLWEGGGPRAIVFLVILVEEGQMYHFVPNEKHLPPPPKKSSSLKFQNYRLLLDYLNFLWVNFNLF